MAVGLQTEINVAGAIPAGLSWSLSDYEHLNQLQACEKQRRAKKIPDPLK